MNCLDARGEFTALVDGKIGLSEWVPLEAHVAKCADCRKLLDRLYSMKPRNEPQWARASTGPIDLPDESTDIIEVVTPAHRSSSHRAVWVSVAAVALMLGAVGGLVTYGSHLNLGSSLVALLHKVRPEARHPEVAPAPSLSAPPQTTRPEAPQADVAAIPPPSVPPQNIGPEGRQAEVASTPPPPTPPQKVRPEGRAPEVAAAPPPSAPPPERVPPKSTPPVELAPPKPAPPVSAPEPKTSGKAKESSARPPASLSPAPSLPSRVSKPPRPATSREATAAMSEPEPPAIDPSALVEAGKIDVAVQLSVRNRKDAERDLTMLLTRVGGTKFGHGQSTTLMASVPRSSYSEFTRGLTQIGSWQLEAGRSSLPDPVHVAVKLAK